MDGSKTEKRIKTKISLLNKCRIIIATNFQWIVMDRAIDICSLLPILFIFCIDVNLFLISEERERESESYLTLFAPLRTIRTK